MNGYQHFGGQPAIQKNTGVIMGEKEAVERVVVRMAREKAHRTGQAADSKDMRAIERKARKIAQESDNRKRRK